MHKNFSERGFEDYMYWQTQDKKTLKRINNLLQEIDRNGYNCIGKPEQLKGDKAGWWSVRIDEKNRLIFKIENEVIEIAQCRTHYGDK